MELVDGGSGLAFADAILLMLVPMAILLFLANLPSMAAEVRHVRIAKPLRIAQEDALAAAQKAPRRVQDQPLGRGVIRRHFLRQLDVQCRRRPSSNRTTG